MTMTGTEEGFNLPALIMISPQSLWIIRTSKTAEIFWGVPITGRTRFSVTLTQQNMFREWKTPWSCLRMELRWTLKKLWAGAMHFAWKIQVLKMNCWLKQAFIECLYNFKAVRVTSSQRTSSVATFITALIETVWSLWRAGEQSIANSPVAIRVGAF